MIPTPEELEKIRAEFAAVPSCLDATIEVVPAHVRVIAKVGTLSFGNARPIYHKEMEFFERFPDLSLEVRVEDLGLDFESSSEENPAGKSEGEARTDQAFVIGINWLLQRESQQAIADRLMVSLPTIERWAAGTNLPHRSLRDSIWRAFEKSS